MVAVADNNDLASFRIVDSFYRIFRDSAVYLYVVLTVQDTGCGEVES